MDRSSGQKTDLKDCLTVLLKDKNKRLSFEEWKNRKYLQTYKHIQTCDAESCVVHSFDQMVLNANKKSLSNWMRIKNIEAKKTSAKQKNQEICLKKGENELKVLKRELSKKAFRNWLKNKEKEIIERNLRMKEGEACHNMCDEYFYLVKSDYNKKAVKDWLYYLRARHT